MRVISGDETGLLKQVALETGVVEVWGEQKRELGVTSMCWNGAESDGVIAGLRCVFEFAPP
jgi:hypothetical protein